MTKEIRDIILAYKEAQRHGRKAALATVVHVEGSSYRRPGARMLVEDDGRMTGAISGGCLEGDALRKAQLAISQQQNKLVTYNSLDDEDASFGVQLGCNGIVHILFEPIDPGGEDNPVALLEKCMAQRRDAVLVTLFSLQNYTGLQPGTCYYSDGDAFMGTITDAKLFSRVSVAATEVLAAKSTVVKPFGAVDALIAWIGPAVSLVIVGAGNDALPLLSMANLLGWQVTVVDGRRSHATLQRFPAAHRIIAGKPVDVLKQIPVDDRTFFVLMTHNYNYDLEMLGLLLHQPCGYIGTLGPRKRLNRMLMELNEKGSGITARQRSMIYGPTGLDIGAEAAEEIALSVLAEIRAVMAGRSGGLLRDRQDGIHQRPDAETKELNAVK